MALAPVKVQSLGYALDEIIIMVNAIMVDINCVFMMSSKINDTLNKITRSEKVVNRYAIYI